MRDMDEQAPAQDAKLLRYLKWLVTGLTATMILGFLTIVALFVMRFNAMSDVELPDTIALPEGAAATAFTQGDDWFAVVTADDEILIYSLVTGNLRQRIKVEAE